MVLSGDLVAPAVTGSSFMGILYRIADNKPILWTRTTGFDFGTLYILIGWRDLATDCQTVGLSQTKDNRKMEKLISEEDATGTAAEVYADIKQNFGMIPDFFKAQATVDPD